MKKRSRREPWWAGSIAFAAALADRSRGRGRAAPRARFTAMALSVSAGLIVAAAVRAGLNGRAQAVQVTVVQTSHDLSERLSTVAGIAFERSHPPRGVPVITVDDRVHYQQVKGFGAAMTDTAAWLLYDELSPEARARVMDALFGPGGIRLGFLRVPMGGSDFTRDRRPYSYDDLPPGPPDTGLVHFSVTHDLAYIVPAVREALALNPGLQILADPWSPPGWMKSNQALDNQANQGLLLNSAYAALAHYFVKFLQAYARLGVPIDAITPQNEPTNPTTYPGLDLPSKGERQFIVRYLRPALHNAGLDPKVYGGDGGWDATQTPYTAQVDGQTVPLVSGRDYVDTLLTGRLSRAAGPHPPLLGAMRQALAGVAWHCYFGDPGVMSRLHQIAPHLDQIVDECSPGITPFPVSESVIASLRNWASAVALWNLALDPRGGPVQPPNNGCPTCNGVVTVDRHSHAVKLTSSYFQLGQASEFVRPGAYRVESRHFVSYRYLGRGVSVISRGLDDVALLNPDGRRVLLVYDNARAPIRFAVEWRGHSFTYTMRSRETATFIWAGQGAAEHASAPIAQVTLDRARRWRATLPPPG